MREEIEAAVHFVGRVIVSSHNASVRHFSEFKTELSKTLETRFQGHWHTDVPGKGQGYRSIRIHPLEPVDPVLKLAAEQSRFSMRYLHIPVELTLWVDPKDVSCRFGDLKATYCTVLKDKDNKSNTIDVDELMETAKALYYRQQNFTVPDDCSPRSDLPFLTKGELFHYNMHTNPYSDSFLLPPFPFYPGWQGDVGEGSTTPPLPYPPSFSSSAVNTTPRKNGKNNSHFRKGSNGTGRGSKHHQQQNNGDVGTYNHNHNNNHNTTSNGSNGNGGGTWSGDRFHWVRGTRNQQQHQSSPQQSSFHHQQQQHQKQQEQKPVQNSVTEKEGK